MEVCRLTLGLPEVRQCVCNHHEGEGQEMSEPDDNRPAMRDDVIYAVFVLLIAIILCNVTDSCNRRLEINKLREDLQQQRR